MSGDGPILSGQQVSNGARRDPEREKPTTRLEDTQVVDDGNVDMAELSKSGGGELHTTGNDFFLGFLTALLLSSVAWGAVWLVV